MNEGCTPYLQRVAPVYHGLRNAHARPPPVLPARRAVVQRLPRRERVTDHVAARPVGLLRRDCELPYGSVHKEDARVPCSHCECE